MNGLLDPHHCDKVSMEKEKIVKERAWAGLYMIVQSTRSIMNPLLTNSRPITNAFRVRKNFWCDLANYGLLGTR